MPRPEQWEIIEAIKTMIRLLDKDQAQQLHDYLYDYTSDLTK